MAETIITPDEVPLANKEVEPEVEDPEVIVELESEEVPHGTAKVEPKEEVKANPVTGIKHNNTIIYLIALLFIGLFGKTFMYQYKKINRNR